MDLINHLPNINSISDIEIRVILAEIICGNLEWAYHENDGEFKMAAYAHQSLERYGGFQGAFLKEDIETLKILPIWNYLCKGQKSQLSRYSETGD